MKKGFVYAICFLVLSCNSSTETKDGAATEQTAADLEKSQPLKYLSVNASIGHDENGEVIVEGSVINKATATGYKDITMAIEYMDKTGAMLGSERKPIDPLPAGTTMPFTIKSTGPKETVSVSVEIARATPE
jgi:hypothetical protein